LLFFEINSRLKIFPISELCCGRFYKEMFKFNECREFPPRHKLDLISAPGEQIKLFTLINLLGDFWEKPITKEKIKFLQLSTCGFANDVPKICCPIDTRSISRRTIKATTTITTVSTSTTSTTTTPSTTTNRLRITEETTRHNPHTQSSAIGNNLRRGVYLYQLV